MSEPSAEFAHGYKRGDRPLPLSRCTDPLRLTLRRPRVADRFGGQDQAPPDCGGVTPERVQRRVLVVPVFQARKGRLVDPTTPGHIGQGESRRLAGSLDLLHERAQLAILAVEVEVRSLAAGNQLFGRGVPGLETCLGWTGDGPGLQQSTGPWAEPCLLCSFCRSSFLPPRLTRDQVRFTPGRDKITARESPIYASATTTMSVPE